MVSTNWEVWKNTYQSRLSNKEIWVEVLGMAFEVEETKEVGPTQRRDKEKVLYLPDDGTEHYSKPENINQAKPLPESTAPR